MKPLIFNNLIVLLMLLGNMGQAQNQILQKSKHKRVNPVVLDLGEPGSPKAAYNIIASSTNTCAGLCDGSITITLSGTPTFPIYLKLRNTALCPLPSPNVCQSVFNLNAGDFPYTFTGLCGSGTAYSVQATDNDSTKRNANNIPVVEYSAITVLTEAVTNPKCAGNCDGNIDIITLDNAFYPVDYTWNRGDNVINEFDTVQLSNVCVGTWIVTITDNEGCIGIFSYDITEPDTLIAPYTKTDVTCFGLADGSITMNPSGGTPGYSYNWSDIGVGGSFRSPLAPAAYSVTVTDVNGCDTIVSITITQPGSGVSVSVIGTDPTCNGVSDGSATASSTGGTTPYTYTWSTGTIYSPDSVATGLSCSVSYTVTVTDLLGCTDNTTFSLNCPPALVVSAGSNSPICEGATLNLTSTGGFSSYSWTGPNGPVPSVQNPSIAGVTSADAGTYTVNVTDVSGCPGSATTDVTVNPLPTITNTTPGSRCDAGTVVLGATASAGTVNWYADAVTPVSLGTGTSYTTPSISSTTTYYVSATNLTCTSASRTAVVATIYTTPSITNTTPASRCDAGTLILGATASSDTIYWYAAAAGGSPLGSGTSYTTPSIAVTTTYYVGASSNGCATPARTAVVATVNTAPSILTTTPGSRCGTGTVTLGATASAGTVNWYTASTGGGSVATGTSYTTPSISVTTTYYVDATANGCTTSSRTAVVATVNPLPDAAGVINGTPTVCQGQTGVAYSVGAIANATSYTWTYTGSGATINGTTNSITIDFNATATSGNLTVQGTNACGSGTVSANYAITVNPLPGAAGAINGTSTVCQGQSGVVYNVGAIAGATSYTWVYSGADVTINGNTNSITIDFGAAATSGNLTVTGVNACGNGTVSANYAITVNTLPGAAGAINGTPTVCQGQSGVAYNVGAIAGATSYTWTYTGSGATINGTTNSITIDFSATATSGNLTVQGTNACGSGTVSTNYAITVNPLPGVAGAINGSPIVCQGQTGVIYDVAAIANATTYTWTYSGTGATINGNTNSITIDFSATATSGNLTVQGTNACGNGTVSANYAITVNPLPGAAGAINGSPIVCQGQTGVIYDIIVIPNATSYTWSYTGSGATINGTTNSITIDFSATATSGNLTVTGVNACGNGTVSANYAITVNPLPGAAGAINGSPTVCQGQTGVIYNVAAITNATTYTWTYSGTGATINGNTNSITIDFSATATSGNLTVTGVNACGSGTVSANYAITVNPLPGAAGAINGSPTVCQGQTGVIYDVAAITNATTYTWTYSGAGATINGNTNSITIDFSATATSGNLTVTGVNACGNGTVSANYAITVNSLPGAAGAINGDPAVCQGDNGVVYNVAAITNAATYTWTYSGTGATINGNTNSITIDFSATATSGNLTVTGTNACGNGTVSANYAITVTPIPTITNTTPGARCDAGTVVLGATTSAGTIYWYSDTTAAFIGSGTSFTTPVLASTTTYYVQADNGCLSNPFVPVVATVGNVGVTILKTDVTSCTGGTCDGTITVTVTSGTAPFIFSSNGTPAAPTGSPYTFTTLCVGTYTILVQDAIGCTSLPQDITISAPNAPSVVNSSFIDPKCYNGTDGSATLTISGGTAPYDYVWGGACDVLGTGALTNTCNSLDSGSYTVTVTDANNCSVNQTFDLTHPAQLLVNITDSTMSCGTLPTVVAGTTFLPDGTGMPYTTTITHDAFGPADVITSVNDIQAVTMNIEHSYAGDLDIDLICPNGQTLTIVDFLSPPNLQNTWFGVPIDDEGLAPGTGWTYSISASASSGIPLVGGEQSLPAGSYLPDGSFNSLIGCPLNGDWTIRVFDNLEVDNGYIFWWRLDFNPAMISSICSGSATATITGGTPAYTINWSNGESNVLTIDTLCPGDYYIDVVDANSCTASDTITITNSGVTVNPTHIDPVCFNDSTGSAVANPSGGSGNYTYQWQNTGWIVDSTGASIQNLAAGNYDLTVTDASWGCTDDTTITLTQPTPISIAWSKTDVACNGTSTGSITLTASGGVPPYNYGLTDQTSQNSAGMVTFPLLPAGTYTVSVTDANGCVNSDTVITIIDPAVILINPNPPVVTSPVQCTGGQGTITVVASGGSGPLTYLILGTSVSNATGVFDTLCGTYQFVVSDPNGCADTSLPTVMACPLPVTVVQSSTDETPCYNSDNGTITLTASGGTAPYIYQVSGQTNQNSAGSVTFNSLTAGSYGITVTDNNGCSGTVTTPMLIGEPDSVYFFSINVVNASGCAGASNGEIHAVGAGGVGSFTYLLTPPGTSNFSGDFTGLTAGDYQLSITDGNGCDRVDTVTITGPSPISITKTYTPLTCTVLTTDLQLTANGGTPPYVYTLNPPNTSNATGFFTGLTAGTYYITVVDGATCTYLDSVTISPAPAISADTVSSSNVICFGQSNGAATIRVLTGTAPYRFAWNSGLLVADDSTRINLPAGCDTVIVEDANACKDTVSFCITEPLVLSNSFTITNADCNQSNGAATANVAGGNGGYTYVWAPGGETTAGITNKPANTYSLTITDQKGCSLSDNAVIINPQAGTLSFAILAVDTCWYDNYGSAAAIITGGTPPYNFQWDATAMNQTNDTAVNLNPNNYWVTVTDSDSCITIGDTAIISLSVAIGIAQIDSVAANCFGDANGSLTVVASGGTPPLTYAIDCNTFGASGTFTGLAGGNYNVCIKDANQCRDTTRSINVINPPQIQITDTSNTDITCNGLSNGSINITVTGGTGTLHFAWDNGAPATEDISNLAPGNYTVTVTDDSLCSVIGTPINIAEPDTLTSSATTVLPGCPPMTNGSITITAIGGTPLYTYALSGQGSSINAGPVTFSSLGSGIYTYTITDNNGCVDSATVTLNSTGAGVLSFTQSDSNKCSYSATTDVLVTVTGGSGSYTYAWCDGQSTNPALNLPAGTCDITVTDVGTGCLSFGSVTVTAPPSISVSFTQTNPTCFGDSTGSFTIIASGGTGALEYSRDSIVWNLTTTYSNLPAGTYYVWVRDDNDCAVKDTVILTAPSQISPNMIVTQSHCGQSDGGASVNPSGGTPGYTYLWTGGSILPIISNQPSGTYSVTITDNALCSLITTAVITDADGPSITFANVAHNKCFGESNGSVIVIAAGGTTPYNITWEGDAPVVNDSVIKTGLAAGCYNVTVTDSAGCSSLDSICITEPTDIVLSLDLVQQILCNGASSGKIVASATGGTGTFNFCLTPAVTGCTTTGVFDNLPPDNYTITVNDSNACQKTVDTSITEPPVITLNTVYTPIICHNDFASLVVTASGGSGSFTYDHDGTLPGDLTGDYPNLTEGTWQVTVTDSYGCIKTTASYNVVNPDEIDLTLSKIDPNTCTSTTGSAIVAITGGVGPYDILWNTVPSQTTDTASNLAAGCYMVTVTDSLTCKDSAAICLTAPGSFNVTASAINANLLCYGDTNGSAYVTYSGGISPYFIQWSTGATTDTVYNLPGGIVSVTVTDSSPCPVSDTAMINQPDPITAAIFKTDATCYDSTNGTLNIVPSGGTFPYFYSINGGLTYGASNNFSNLSPGVYNICIKDMKSCDTCAWNVTIAQPPDIILPTPSVSDVKCNGQDNGIISVTASGSLYPPYEYTINFTTNMTGIFTGMAPISYTVSVNDANGCSQASAPVTVNEPAAIILSTLSSNTACNTCNGSATVWVASGGTPGFTFTWDSAAVYYTGSNPTGLCAGAYWVTATDANGCTASTSALVSNPGAGTLSFSPVTNILCNSYNTGSATVNVTGGSGGPYTYLWQTSGQTTQTAVNISAGLHSVEVTDSAGCMAVDTVILTEPSPGISIQLTGTTDISCNGGNDGTISITASGGTGTLLYKINNGPYDVITNFTGLTAGTHTVYVKDDNDCIDSNQVILSQPNTITLTAVVDPPGCGMNDGSISVFPGGGTLAYGYLWDDSSTNQLRGNLGADTVSVTVTDGMGCTTDSSFVLVNPGAGTISFINIVHNQCFGDATGQATVVMTGGTPPFTYLWEDLQDSVTAVNLPADTFTVSVEDFKHCTTSAYVTITEPPQINFTTEGVSQQINCFGETGQITVVATGGTNLFSYRILPPGTGWQSTGVFNVPAGSYTVLAQDSNRCQKTTDTVTLIAPPQLAHTDTFNNISCNGADDASLVIVASGGTPGVITPYWFTLQPGVDQQASGNYPGLQPGSWTVLIEDSLNCNVTAGPFDVVDPAALNLVISTIRSACLDSTGRAIVVVSGGTPQYSIAWDSLGSPAFNDTLSGIPSGSYGITVTDANGCISTNFAPVSDTNTCAVIFTNVVPVRCFGDANGQATALLASPCIAVSYLWSTGETTATAVNLPGGSNSTCEITDNNGCKAVDTIDPGTPEDINISIVKNDVTCNGMTDGYIHFDVSGGTPLYDYSITDTITGFVSTPDFMPLGPGTYPVIVRDSNDCIKFGADVTITAPSGITFIDTVITNASCYEDNNGAISLTATGGFGNLHYVISSSTFDTVAVGNFTNLIAGNYDITVTDDNGCRDTALALMVSQPTAITVTMQIDTSTCGHADGIICLTPSGGTPGYTFLWGPSAGSVQTACASNLASGNHGVTITDSQNCSLDTMASMSDSAAAVISLTIVDNLCFGYCAGSATAMLTGGVEPYHYQYSSGAEDTLTTVTGLCAGNYSLQVTDAAGCGSSKAFTIGQPGDIVISLNNLDSTLCYGYSDGLIEVTASGGTPGYSYSIDAVWQLSGAFDSLAAGSYYITVTDTNSCIKVSPVITVNEPLQITITPSWTEPHCGQDDGSATVIAQNAVPVELYQWDAAANNQANASAISLGAGTYTCTVTDANTCKATATVSLSDQDGPGVVLNASNSLCSDTCSGTATAIGTGGLPPYDYLWYPSNEITQTIMQKCEGYYKVRVQDANGCVKFDSVLITQPDTISVSYAVTPNLCSGDSTGAITWVVTGGTSPYQCIVDSVNYLTPDTVYSGSLAGGTYLIIVTDTNNCTGTFGPVTVTPPTAIVLSSFADSSICMDSTGAAHVIATGGTPGYTYSWLNNPGLNDSVQTGLPANVYPVTVTDVNGCKDSTKVNIPDIDAPVITFDTVTNVLCNGDSTGFISAVITEGHPGYTFVWSNGELTLDNSGLAPGDYSITVTDTIGCKNHKDTTIDEPNELILTVDSLAGVKCYADTNGAIKLSAIGGVIAYQFSIDGIDYATAQLFPNLAADDYTVFVKDQNGCIDSLENIVVAEPSEIDITMTGVDPTCSSGSSDGSVTASVSGGTIPYTYQWFPTGGTTNPLLSLQGGKYKLTVTDSKLCTSVDSMTIAGLTVVNCNAGPDTSVCETKSITLHGNGGTTYEWLPDLYLNSNTVQNPIVTPATTAVNIEYRLVCTVNGCKDTDMVNVAVKHAVLIDAGAEVSLLAGESTYLNATGGESGTTYQWTPSTGLSSTTITNPEVNPDVTRYYHIIATSQNGCISEDSVKVNVIPKIQFAEAISPNGDNINETWVIRYHEFYTSIVVSVYNRWGELLFHNEGCTEFWDGKFKGKELPVGTYYYVIVVEEPEGKSVLTGPVSIIR